MPTVVKEKQRAEERYTVRGEGDTVRGGINSNQRSPPQYSHTPVSMATAVYTRAGLVYPLHAMR